MPSSGTGFSSLGCHSTCSRSSVNPRITLFGSWSQKPSWVGDVGGAPAPGLCVCNESKPCPGVAKVTYGNATSEVTSIKGARTRQQGEARVRSVVK